VLAIYIFPPAISCKQQTLVHKKNSEIHNIDTRQNNNLYPPITSLTEVQKGAYYSGIKIYNHLPTTIKELSNEQKPFRSALKRFLYINSFYSMEVYFNYKM
jgi:hypothetical protein